MPDLGTPGGTLGLLLSKRKCVQPWASLESTCDPVLVALAPDYSQPVWDQGVQGVQGPQDLQCFIIKSLQILCWQLIKGILESR